MRGRSNTAGLADLTIIASAHTDMASYFALLTDPLRSRGIFMQAGGLPQSIGLVAAPNRGTKAGTTNRGRFISFSSDRYAKKSWTPWGLKGLVWSGNGLGIKSFECRCY